MKQIKQLYNTIIQEGVKKESRVGNTISVFGPQVKYDLREGFPIVTTKKVPFNLVYWELIWFLSGRSDLQFLLDKNVNIWNDDAFRFYKSKNSTNLTKEEFIKKIKSKEEMYDYLGDLGPIYGVQWRNWTKYIFNYNSHSGSVYLGDKVDQIENVIKSIQTNPNSRRHIVSAWNVAELDSMALPPCHILFQFYVNNEFLDLKLYQR